MIHVVKSSAGIALLLVSLGACGGPSGDEARERQMEEYAARYGVDADIEIDDRGEVSTTINTAGGGQVGTNLNLPAGFPDDVPVYSELKIYSATPTPGQLQGFMIQAQTESAASDIVAFYTREMAANGWTQSESQPAAASMERLSFTKDDRTTAVVIMDTGASKTVQLSTMVMPN